MTRSKMYKLKEILMLIKISTNYWREAWKENRNVFLLNVMEILMFDIVSTSKLRLKIRWKDH